MTEEPLNASGAGEEHNVWDLEEIRNRTRAINFVMQFKKTMCVYSGPVQQLYTNYDIFLPQGEDKKMVILPNPLEPQDTYNFIPADAVTPTGLNIIPGDLIGKSGLYLSLPLKPGEDKPKCLPLTAGFHAIIKRHPPDKPFLPVLTKGDLREFSQDVPCVHLHKIHIDKIEGLSGLDLQGIVKGVTDKLSIYLYPGRQNKA
jgi:hypothetical protein